MRIAVITDGRNVLGTTKNASVRIWDAASGLLLRFTYQESHHDFQRRFVCPHNPTASR